MNGHSNARGQQTACSGVTTAPRLQQKAVGEGGRPLKPHQWPVDEAAAAGTPAGGRPLCGPATRDPVWGGTRPLGQGASFPHKEKPHPEAWP